MLIVYLPNLLHLLQQQINPMSLTSQSNNKGGKGKSQNSGAQASKFIAKPGKTSNPVVKKKTNTGSRRGS